MRDRAVRPLPEQHNGWLECSGSEPIVLRGAAFDWPIAHLVTSRRFLEKYRDQEVRAQRADGETAIMSLGAAMSDNRRLPPEKRWYASWNAHSQRGTLVGALPAGVASWFEHLPAQVRPSWTWVYVGSRGTGSSLHIDTMGSSAWNAVLSGTKQWRIMSPRRSSQRGLLPPSIAAAADATDEIEYSCTQGPGDLLIVPSGWAHEVSNPTDTIAITGNFVNGSNIAVVEATFAHRGEQRWLEVTRRVHTAMSSKPGESQ